MRKVVPGVLLFLLSVSAAVFLFPRISMTKLTVLTVPSGADVFVNGVMTGVSPVTGMVSDDGVLVVARKTGFFPAETLFRAESDTLLLHLREGSLVIVNTLPPGCSVNCGTFTGVSPCSLVVESGSVTSITVTSDDGISVTRTINLLSPETKLLNFELPFEYTDTAGVVEFVVIPEDLLPFAVGALTVGKSEVTAGQFAVFMNAVDPELVTDSTTLTGRTCLMDSILKCNWRGPVGFNEDTTSYRPLPGMEDYPMVGMTQQGAVWYCEWLTSVSQSGLEYRLPDCDEWEILASVGPPLTVNLSDTNETILMRHPEIDDGWAMSAPAGSMGCNYWGLSEMQGNVWEWVSSSGAAMGGSWLSSVEDCATDSKILLDTQLGYPFTGFRVVAGASPEHIAPLRGSSTERKDYDDQRDTGGAAPSSP